MTLYPCFIQNKISYHQDKYLRCFNQEVNPSLFQLPLTLPDTFDHSMNIVEQHVYIQRPSEKGKIYNCDDAFTARDAYFVNSTELVPFGVHTIISVVLLVSSQSNGGI